MTSAPNASVAHKLNPGAAVRVFLVFAFAYFISTLIRAITATLAPTLTLELSLQASDLGLLAGGYFLGFAAMQLPLGNWLDRHGPKSVILCFLSIAALGCVAFAMATSFLGLLAARVLCGAGLGACLMAPLTGYRRWFAASLQLRANSWMLMTGSLGMLASTLPVQWLMPVLGWRALFWILTALVLLAMGLIAWQVPGWAKAEAPPVMPFDTASVSASAPTAVNAPGYAEVWRHPYFRRLMPMGFFIYGGMVAMQTLWAGPWMVKVAGFSALQAATGLFTINIVMLCTFWTWGMLSPWLAQRGFSANALMAWGLPLSFVALAVVIAAGSALSTYAAGIWALFFVGCSFVSLSQPALALVFPSTLAGRALSAFNLVLFAGVFTVQWGIGLGVDAFKAAGFAEVMAFQAAMGVFLLCCVGSYLWFLMQKDAAAPQA